MKRRMFLFGVGALALLPAHGAPAVQVFKSAQCGCCSKWVEHLQANGFTVKASDVRDVSEYRARLGVPAALGSCHTGLVDGYAIEGHVPAREIKRLLAERPSAKGLAVPAMPLGSPGMEGVRRDPYEVLLFDAAGGYRVYQKYPAG